MRVEVAAAPTEVLLPPVCSRPRVTPFSPFFLHFRLRMSDRVKIRKESTRMSALGLKAAARSSIFPQFPGPYAYPAPLLAFSASTAPFRSRLRRRRRRRRRPSAAASPPPLFLPTISTAQGDKMGHYAARKILQSSLRQASPAAVVHSLRSLLLVGPRSRAQGAKTRALHGGEPLTPPHTPRI